MSDATAAPAAEGAAGTSNAEGQAPETDDGFELEEGRKLSKDELKQHWAAIRTNYQKGKSAAQMMSKAEQRLREAQKYEQYKPESLKERLKDRSAREKFLEELGLDRRQFAEELLLPEIEREMMTEEQRALAEERRKREEVERKLQDREQKETKEREEAQVREQQAAIGQRMVQALQKVGLPKESAPWGVRRMAALMDKQIELGLDLSDDELATLVRQDFEKEHASLYESMPAEALVQMFPGLVKKLRAYDLAQLKARTQPGAPRPQQQPQTAAPMPKNGKGYLTPEESKKILEQRISEMQSRE